MLLCNIKYTMHIKVIFKKKINAVWNAYKFNNIIISWQTFSTRGFDIVLFTLALKSIHGEILSWIGSHIGYCIYLNNWINHINIFMKLKLSYLFQWHFKGYRRWRLYRCWNRRTWKRLINFPQFRAKWLWAY